MILLPEFLKNGPTVQEYHRHIQISFCELGLGQTMNSHHWWLPSALNYHSYYNKLITF